MSKDAQAAREQTKKALSAVEQRAYDSRKQREAELSATRKEVERRKAEAEKVSGTGSGSERTCVILGDIL